MKEVSASPMGGTSLASAHMMDQLSDEDGIARMGFTDAERDIPSTLINAGACEVTIRHERKGHKESHGPQLSMDVPRARGNRVVATLGTTHLMSVRPPRVMVLLILLMIP